VSNQKKDELSSDNFGIQSFWGVPGKISSRARLMPMGMVCPEISDSATQLSFDSCNSEIANHLEPGNKQLDI
jgi:hypothetical protein